MCILTSIYLNPCPVYCCDGTPMAHSRPHQAHRLLTHEDVVIYQSILMRCPSGKLIGLTPEIKMMR
jgi:hypothetical protein